MMSKDWKYFLGFEFLCAAYFCFIKSGLQCEPCLPNVHCPPCITDDMIIAYYLAIAGVTCFFVWKFKNNKITK